MPFTPFHLGPGAVFKAIGGRHFSFLVFAGSQVLMDIEPLIGILQHKAVLHGYTHTILGALALGAVAAVAGKPISAFALRILEIPHFPMTWHAACTGAFSGTYSHIALDAIMHRDMNPWWPLVPGNPLLGTVTLDWLHLSCLVVGILGVTIIALRYKRHSRV